MMRNHKKETNALLERCTAIKQQVEELALDRATLTSQLEEATHTLTLHEQRIRESEEATNILLERLTTKEAELYEARLALASMAAQHTTLRRTAAQRLTSVARLIRVGDEMTKRSWPAQVRRWEEAKAAIK